LHVAWMLKTSFASCRSEWYKVRVTSNTITIRLRRPKAEIEAAARPNVNAWVNKLIERALASQPVDWKEHFKRKSQTRRFHFRSDEVRKQQRR
jgi:hypothetical protein